MNVLDSINHGLHRAMGQDAAVYLLGEDILDPYGGAFKVTKGLSTAFPDRVLTTPISEAGIVGFASGMALRGMKPVVEIMFGDFITLAADQIVNHIAKFHWMYNEQVSVPMVIRTPMGGRRGYGPTHSQTLEKMFYGIPGLKIIAPSTFGNPGDLLSNIILQEVHPVLFIENKLQYLLMLDENNELDVEIINVDSSYYPVYRIKVKGAPPAELTITGYGYMGDLLGDVLLALAYDHEIFAELIVPTRIAPFDVEKISESARDSGNLIVCEEGTVTAGWGAEVSTRVIEKNPGKSIRILRIGAKDLPIPASGKLEDEIIPDEDAIIKSIIQLLDR